MPVQDDQQEREHIVVEYLKIHIKDRRKSKEKQNEPVPFNWSNEAAGRMSWTLSLVTVTGSP